jgi:catalase
MALEFRVPDGSRQHMARLNTPLLVAAQPVTFAQMVKAMKPDPGTGEPDPGRLHDFLDLHPDAFAQWTFGEVADPTSSYANSPYFSIHAYRFIDTLGRTHSVRWRFMPLDEAQRAAPSQAVSTHGILMEQLLIERLRSGPVRWDMIVYVGEPDDATDNASIAWPESRRHFKAGTLTIARALPGRAADCQKASFDPLIVADGIALSDDPILLFRSPTYASGFVRRLPQALRSTRSAADCIRASCSKTRS